MSEQNENTNIDGYTSDNDSYNNASMLQIRLNTEPVIAKIELFLRGEREKYGINEQGQPVVIAEKIGESKANNEGIHSIMIWLSGLLNSQIVQGNIENFAEKDNKIADIREDLSEYIMKNLVNWEISDAEYEGIIDLMITQLDLFLSRLVGNKERDSFTHTMKHVENNSSQVRNKGFKFSGF